MSPDGPQAAPWPWGVLGLPAMPPDASDVRRAYARALKQINQATDIEGFAALRAAYEYGLALREGRSTANLQRKARKAEATAKKQAAPENAAETIPDDRPPAPDPAALAAAAKAAANAAAFAALRVRLITPNLLTPAGRRITDALAHPLSHDPAYGLEIRLAMAELLRASVRSDEYHEPTLSPEITAETLLALDARYGWLNDYAAYRRDFRGDTQLQDLIATRAYGSLKRGSPPRKPTPKGWIAFVWRFYQSYPIMIWIAYVALLRGGMVFLETLGPKDRDSGFITGLVILALSPMMLMLAMVFWSIFRTILGMPAGILRRLNRQRHRIEDWWTIRQRRKP